MFEAHLAIKRTVVKNEAKCVFSFLTQGFWPVTVASSLSLLQEGQSPKHLKVIEWPVAGLGQAMPAWLDIRPLFSVMRALTHFSDEASHSLAFFVISIF